MSLRAIRGQSTSTVGEATRLSFSASEPSPTSGEATPSAIPAIEISPQRLFHVLRRQLGIRTKLL